MIHEASQTIELAIGAPHRARVFVPGSLSDWGLPERGDVDWCVSELVTNAMFFGTEPASITVLWDAPLLRIEISDAGPRESRMGAPGDRRTSGRGLEIVDAVSDGWGVRPVAPAGRMVWFGLIVEPGATCGPLLVE